MPQKAKLRKKYFNIRREKYRNIDKKFFFPLLKLIRKKIKTLGVLPLFTLGPVDSRGMGSVLEEADTEICWYVPIHRWLIIPSASGKFATSFGIVNDALTCP